MTLPQDIHQYIETRWPDDATRVRERIHKWEAASGGPPGDRLLRCALYLAKDPDGLEEVIEMACQDERDVYWQAEYGGTEVRMRDFSRTFHENNCL